MGAFKGKISKVLTSFSQGANILTTFSTHMKMSCLPCLSCLPELDNSGDTGGHREMSVSLSHLRCDPFRETAAFLGASQLECDACQVCAQFPGRCWAKFRARGKKDAWSYLPFTTLYTNSDKKKEKEKKIQAFHFDCQICIWCLRTLKEQILGTQMMLWAICASVRQRHWAEIWKQSSCNLVTACWANSLLFPFSTDWRDARPVLLPAPIQSSPLIASIKASSTTEMDVPLQLSADQTSPLEGR